MIIIGPVAVAKNNVIGADNDLPWYIPEDLKRFREITTGKVCLMGRKTFDSITRKLGKPLPNRLNIVISRDEDYPVPAGVLVYSDLQKAIEDYSDKDLFIIGGAQIFAQTMKLGKEMYVTHVQFDAKGDTFFPKIDPKQWDKIEEEPHESFTFAKYVRK